MPTMREIIENHKHFINKDCDGCENMKAKLSYEYLPNIDLHGVDLRGVNLSYANLSNADLHDADLRGTCLTNANLYCANLSGANLYDAILDDVNLAYANLSNADLGRANLVCANLRCADLSNANLLDADLTYAFLSDAYLNDTKGTLIEYRRGKILTEDIVGYKKCKNDIIVTLIIPKGAIVFSINGKKCRTNKAKVIAIDGSDIASSIYNGMPYCVGDEFTIQDFNLEYNSECAEGIHFFMTREEAMAYAAM